MKGREPIERARECGRRHASPGRETRLLEIFEHGEERTLRARQGESFRHPRSLTDAHREMCIEALLDAVRAKLAPMREASVSLRRPHVLDDHGADAALGRELAAPQIAIATPQFLDPRPELERARAARSKNALGQSLLGSLSPGISTGAHRHSLEGGGYPL